MKKLSIEECIKRNSTHIFKCVVCNQYEFRKDQEIHIKKHNISLIQYKKLSEQKRLEKSKYIRGSKEQRELTARITKEQWKDHKIRENRTKGLQIVAQDKEMQKQKGIKISQTKQLTPEKNSNAIKKGWRNCNKIDRAKHIVETRTRNNSYKQSKKTKKLLSKRQTEVFQRRPDLKEKFVKAGLNAILNNRKPTKIEQQVNKFIIKNNLPYKYVGNGKFWVTVNSKHFNFDFINVNSEKKIIEVNGCYWHGCPECFPERKKEYLRSQDKIKSLQEFGHWEALEIWGHEFKDDLWKNKVLEFCNK